MNAEQLTDKKIDAIAKKYAGMGGVEDYRAFARDVAAAARAQQQAACVHQWHFFGDQPNRRCVRCDAVEHRLVGRCTRCPQ